MPSGREVRPGKWSNVIDLFDNGEYSAIWGIYENNKRRCLGVRWNGNGKGFPNQGGNPLWYIEPLFFTRSILLWILNELVLKVELPFQDEHIKNVRVALSEL